MAKTKRYPNGLRIIVEELPSVLTVSSGIWVGVGSALENASINGMSHFTEHMLFKGTDKLNAFQVADAFESVGAVVNAFTGKENTCYYVKSTDEESEHCFSLLSQIFFDSVFPEDEIDRERNVILEEFNMVEDTPEELCFDLIASTLYPSSQLGQTILGPAANISRFTPDDIRTFMGQFYRPSNIVISFAGKITLEQADEWVGRYVLPKMSSAEYAKQPTEVLSPSKRFASRIKDFEQANIIASFPGVCFDHQLSPVQAILNMIMGGGMSSRLFQRIREQLGLAYSVYTTPSQYVNAGNFNIVLNITPSNTTGAINALRQEIDKLLDGGVGQSEFERAKAQLKSTFIFARENVQICMSSAGRVLLLVDKIFDYKQRIEDISNVTLDQVNQFARKIFDYKQCSCAYVGREVDFSAFESFVK